MKDGSSLFRTQVGFPIDSISIRKSLGSKRYCSRMAVRNTFSSAIHNSGEHIFRCFFLCLVNSNDCAESLDGAIPKRWASFRSQRTLLIAHTEILRLGNHWQRISQMHKYFEDAFCALNFEFISRSDVCLHQNQHYIFTWVNKYGRCDVTHVIMKLTWSTYRSNIVWKWSRMFLMFTNVIAYGLISQA